MAEIRLTEQQRAAVENRGGSLLVSAAAGSGKTKVLVERVFSYLTEEHCHVDDFLIITYTRAAAAELRGKRATARSSCRRASRRCCGRVRGKRGWRSFTVPLRAEMRRARSWRTRWARDGTTGRWPG